MQASRVGAAASNFADIGMESGASICLLVSKGALNLPNAALTVRARSQACFS